MKHCMRFAAEDIAHASLPLNGSLLLPFLLTPLVQYYDFLFIFLTLCSLGTQLDLMKTPASQ